MEQPARIAEADGHAEEQQQLGAIAGVGEQSDRRHRVGEQQQDAGDEDEQQRHRRQAVCQQQLANLIDGHAAPEQEIDRGHGPGQGDHGAIVQRHQQIRVQHLSQFPLVDLITSFLLDAIGRG
ncbi:hypothetical protein D3C80_951250 [compost metagenome]